MVSLGIDVGATSTRVVILDEKGGVVAFRRVFTATQPEPTAWTCWLIREVQNLLDMQAGANQKIEAMGLALPGLIDSAANAVRRSINLPWLEQYPIVKEIKKHFGLVCLLMTDADATTWGEYCAFESASKPNRFVHLRFGTGIACGLVVDGVLEPLEPNRAQHLDFLIFDDSPNALHCECGLHGCLETIASGAAISSLTDRAKLGNTVDELRMACENKSRAADDIVDRIRQAIEIVVDNITAQLSPDAIAIGGGVVNRFPALFDPWLHQSPSQASSVSVDTPTEISQSRLIPPEPRALARAVVHNATMSTQRKTSSPQEQSSTNTIVTNGVLGDRAGAIGAAHLAKTFLAQQPS